MSIPLIWFLFGWLALVALFAFMAFLTIAMTIRFGLSCASTYIYTGIFLFVSAGVLLSMFGYIQTVDWSRSVVLLESSGGILDY